MEEHSTATAAPTRAAAATIAASPTRWRRWRSILSELAFMISLLGSNVTRVADAMSPFRGVLCLISEPAEGIGRRRGARPRRAPVVPRRRNAGPCYHSRTCCIEISV